VARRAVILVLDGVGIGQAHDTAAYGDAGSDTLGNLSRAVGGLKLPHFQRLGLGNIAPLVGVPPTEHPVASHGFLEPRSAGKDSTTGHWEIAGVHLKKAFPTYAKGFPREVIDAFAKATGRKVIGNVVGSGTAVLDSFGEEHRKSGAWIVYTSADSVFQISAHEETIPLDELYAACDIARRQLVAPHDVSRVIARPFVGTPGNWVRTANRKDVSIEPPEETLLDALNVAGIPRTGVGKVDDLFARRGLEGGHTSGNTEGIARIVSWLRDGPDGLLFANLVDFDQLYGHRNDVPGFHQALRDFDAAIPDLIAALREDDLFCITADHGNDPTTPSTDHARENVPLLVLGRGTRAVNLGRRPTFSDLGASVAEWLGIAFRGRGTSFIPQLTR
jgi:phosphopentomutase